MAQTRQIGDITLHRIIEQQGPVFPALHALPGLTQTMLDENRTWLGDALDPQDHLVLCFQSYVVRTPHHTILVDTCIGNHKTLPHRPAWHQKTDATYRNGLAALGLAVEDIDYVVCTHLHADHVGWNTQLLDGRWVSTFPNARYVFAQAELDHWTAQHAASPLAVMTESVLPVIAAQQAELVGSDHQLGDHLRLLPTPGHTPGHVAVALGRSGADAVMTGDLIHSPLQARYPELSLVIDADKAAAAVTRRAFLERFCDTPTLCCTAHFPSPSMGLVKRWGEGFRCEMVE